MKYLNLEYKIRKDDENYKLNSKGGFMIELSNLIEKHGPITIYYIKSSEFEKINDLTKEYEKKITWTAKYTIKNDIKVERQKILPDKEKLKIKSVGEK